MISEASAAVPALILSQYLFLREKPGEGMSNLDKHNLSAGNLLLRPPPDRAARRCASL